MPASLADSAQGAARGRPGGGECARRPAPGAWASLGFRTAWGHPDVFFTRGPRRRLPGGRDSPPGTVPPAPASCIASHSHCFAPPTGTGLAPECQCSCCERWRVPGGAHWRRRAVTGCLSFLFASDRLKLMLGCSGAGAEVGWARGCRRLLRRGSQRPHTGWPWKGCRARRCPGECSPQEHVLHTENPHR